MSKYYRTFPILTLLLFIGGYRTLAVTDVLEKNLLHSRAVMNWAQWRNIQTGDDVGLRDGIPDGWDVLTWGGAKVSYYLNEIEPFTGLRAAVIEQTNTNGGSALVQKVSTQYGSQILASVYAKGDGGALQIQFRRNSKDKWQDGGWINFVPTMEWELYKLSATISQDKTEVRMLLRPSHGIVVFDDAYLGFKTNGHLGKNLLINPEFEQDGNDGDPILWWQKQTESIQFVHLAPRLLNERNLSLRNIADMSAGDFEAIKSRARALGSQCASMPEMTGWLLSLGQKNKELLQERYYQLAIELAPNCPQPYAALADLYAAHLAFKRSAELYHKAVELSDGTVLAGRYAFEEGFIHIRYTGMIAEAISALRKAERVNGWEPGLWYQGVASLYLGYALEAKGLRIEAGRAYQRVLECAICSYHHAEALERLESLSLDTNEPPKEY